MEGWEEERSRNVSRIKNGGFGWSPTLSPRVSTLFFQGLIRSAYKSTDGIERKKGGIQSPATPSYGEQRRRDMFDEKGEGVNLSACVAKREGRARTENASLGLRLPSPFVCLCPPRSLNAEGNEEEEEEGVC